MSSKKITAADKLEIARLYRQAGDTTASLATRYGVSNSTISRLLKTNIPEAEYEILIQQKRGSKVGTEEDSLTTTAAPMVINPTTIPSTPEISYGTSELVDLTPNREDISIASSLPVIPSQSEEDSATRRVRRRSSAPLTVENVENLAVPLVATDRPIVKTPAPIPSAEAIPANNNIDLSIKAPLPIPRTPVLREILADSEHRYFAPVVEPPLFSEIAGDEVEEDEDDDSTEDVNVLAAMFGEEIADGDEDDEEDEDDDEDEATTSNQPLDPNQLLTKDRLHVQITPLSQATLPRTCYIVIDKFAELIVRPLKDFADLGQISGEETQQRTLPIFDNHRVAKRFSNQRTQRVIKVPDSRVFYKTTQHLKLKGITRLLVDGNVYSLN
jgi:transposase-like protein